ncbi:MAG: CbtB domain-containing protein [Hyphomicrobiaceae bacterium]
MARWPHSETVDGTVSRETYMTTTTIQSTGFGASTRVLAAVLFVAGAALVYTIGFAHSTTLHNAAHDSRHALAFPCH